MMMMMLNAHDGDVDDDGDYGAGNDAKDQYHHCKCRLEVQW